MASPGRHGRVTPLVRERRPAATGPAAGPPSPYGKHAIHAGPPAATGTGEDHTDAR
jgi:hypothetical protein